MASQILNRVRMGPADRENDGRHIEEVGPISLGKKMIASDIEIKNFMSALEVYEETGDFVKAMEIVHGHGRFSWFYELH